MLLAHYPNDILARLGIGVLLNKATGRLMGDVETWATFTIGTGLGNALFVNREQ